MLSIGEIPSVYMPSREVRQWRGMILHRKKIAIIAVCRKLLCIMRAMLRDNEKFNEGLAGRICGDGKQLENVA